MMCFFRYTSPDAILKYSRATAGAGISTLLDGEYKEIYLRALDLLPEEMRRARTRMLEFGLRRGNEPRPSRRRPAPGRLSD